MLCGQRARPAQLEQVDAVREVRQAIGSCPVRVHPPLGRTPAAYPGVMPQAALEQSITTALKMGAVFVGMRFSVHTPCGFWSVSELCEYLSGFP